MTQSERKFLENFARAIYEGAIEYHYTFEEENNQLKVVTKSASTCCTRHTLTLSELLKWYKSNINSHYIREYANYFEMSYDRYKEEIQRIIEMYELSNPEYFI